VWSISMMRMGMVRLRIAISDQCQRSFGNRPSGVFYHLCKAISGGIRSRFYLAGFINLTWLTEELFAVAEKPGDDSEHPRASGYCLWRPHLRTRTAGVHRRRTTRIGGKTVTPAPIKPIITSRELEALDIRIGTIVLVEDLPKSSRLVRLTVDFGDRPTGIPCPAAIFAQPLGKDRVAVVQVSDQPSTSGQPPLRFHVLVLALTAYRAIATTTFLSEARDRVGVDRGAMQLRCSTAHPCTSVALTVRPAAPAVHKDVSNNLRERCSCHRGRWRNGARGRRRFPSFQPRH
jgi:tRNA-binding EMAP/Myf-like protein